MTYRIDGATRMRAHVPAIGSVPALFFFRDHDKNQLMIVQD